MLKRPSTEVGNAATAGVKRRRLTAERARQLMTDFESVTIRGLAVMDLAVPRYAETNLLDDAEGPTWRRPDPSRTDDAALNHRNGVKSHGRAISALACVHGTACHALAESVEVLPPPCRLAFARMAAPRKAVRPDACASIPAANRWSRS